MNTTTTATFDIRNFTDRLVPTKEKNRYFCPVCGGNDLTIDPNPKDGEVPAYKCWHECECKDIREKIAPWDEVKGERQPRQQRQRPQPQPQPQPAPIPDAPIELAKLPNPVESPPRVQKGSNTEITYPYSDTKYVVRIQYPDGSKKFIPYHTDAEGKQVKGKGSSWEPYRIAEVSAYGTSKWVLMTEGEKCTEIARQLELVATTPQGSSDPISTMQSIKDAGVLGVIYYPDNDDAGHAKAHNADLAAAKVGLPFIKIDPVRLWSGCPEIGDFADWVEWGKAQGMEAPDFIRQLEEEIHRAVEQKRQHEGRQGEATSTTPPPDPRQEKSKRKQQLNFISSQWGENLRFNEMTLKPELDGNPIDLDTLSIRIADEFDIDVGKETACQIVLYLAKKRLYHPVRDYLELVAAKYPEETLDSLMLNSIAYRYLGSTEPLHNVFMRKHLVGQVRRIFEPGCQHDTAVVLQGQQGVQKSSFWRTLAVNPDWFDDTIASGGNDKDERMKLKRYWSLELAEIDSVFKKKEVASLRAFLTTKSDNLRVPYGTSIESFPRTSCFVGSVNPQQFLSDPEGHRRYWVIPVKVDRIPVDVLQEERDKLWAAAVHAYRKGEQNWLTPGEEKRNALLNKRFEVEDSWQEIIEFYLDAFTETTISDILTNCLKLEVGRHDRSCQMRVSEILKRLGWERSGEKKRVAGSNPTPTWRKVSTGSLQGVYGVSTGVSQASNIDTPIVSSTYVDTFNPLDNAKKIEHQYPDSAENTKQDLNLKNGVYSQGVTMDETTPNQGFQGCDTSVDTLAKSPSVDSNPTLVTVGNQKPKIEPKDLVGKLVKHRDGTIYEVNDLDWKGKLIATATDTRNRAFLTLSDLE